MQKIQNSELILGDGINVFVFSSDACPSCPAVVGAIEKFSANRSENYYLIKRESNAETAIKYDVMSLPTILILEPTKVTKCFTGSTAAKHTIEYLK